MPPGRLPTMPSATNSTDRANAAASGTPTARKPDERRLTRADAVDRDRQQHDQQNQRDEREVGRERRVDAEAPARGSTPGGCGGPAPRPRRRARRPADACAAVRLQRVEQPPTASEARRPAAAQTTRRTSVVDARAEDEQQRDQRTPAAAAAERPDDRRLARATYGASATPTTALIEKRRDAEHAGP